MDEVTGPVIAIALVLCAVFVPTAFMAGISGQFFKQFALTIAASTVISAFNSLTLSPALCAILLKPHAHGEHGHAQQEALPRLGIVLIGGLVGLRLPGRAASAHAGRHRRRRTRARRATRPTPASAAAVWGAAGRPCSPPAASSAGWSPAVVNRVLGAFFRGFNWVFDVTINGYGKAVGAAAARSASSPCWSMAA